MSYRIHILVCMVWVAVTAAAQATVSNLTRAQIDSIVSPSLYGEADKILHADHSSYDLGELSEQDSPISRTFRLRNVSQSVLRIARVRTTCGCTVAAYDSVSVAAGGEMEVTLTFNPKNRPGTIDVDAFVYVEGYESQPMARLSLYGEVVESDVWRHLPHSMGVLRLKRKVVSFIDLPAHGITTRRVLCANSGSRPLRLTSRILPPYAKLYTEPAVIAPGAEADLVIAVDVDKLPAAEGGIIEAPLIVKGVGGRPSERTLRIVIER